MMCSPVVLFVARVVSLFFNFTACGINGATTFDFPHGVTIRNGCEWGNSFNYFTQFLPFERVT